jgi:hypothetical protein
VSAVHGVPRAARRLALASAVVLASCSLAACTSPRNTLGTSTSPCFRALAVARDAVHDRGRFAGVRYFSAHDLARLLVEARPPIRGTSIAGPPRVGLCVVAYQDDFRPGEVELARAERPGPHRYALVVVRLHDVRVLVTLLVRRVPWRLTRVFPTH